MAGSSEPVSKQSRKTVAFTAGFFSSVLSAARARDESSAYPYARFLCTLIRREVENLKLIKQTATQMANLALRLAFEGDFENDFLHMIYRNFFESDRTEKGIRANVEGASKSGGQKTWQWICHMATLYHHNEQENKLIVPTYPAQHPALDRNGSIDNPNKLVAYPDDPSITALVILTDDNRPLGNLLLLARRVWFEGYAERFDEMQRYPILNIANVCLGKRPENWTKGLEPIS